jgi:hypothetical protein
MVSSPPTWRSPRRARAGSARAEGIALRVTGLVEGSVATLAEAAAVHGGELLLQFGTNHVRGLEKFKDSLWRADPIRGAQFRDPNDPDQMLFDFTPTADLAPLRGLLLAHLDALPGRSATFAQLRDFTNEHTVYRVPHATPALEHLRAGNAVTTSPRQTAIRPHTPKNVRFTSTGSEQGDLCS